MKIGILGLGLIGGSIAKALNKKHEISAFDISKESLEYAIKNHIIKTAYKDIDSFLNNNEVIYLCLYPNAIVEFFDKNHALINSKNIFIEISGIKSTLIEKINHLNIHNLRIIYTHPIAGRETSGVTNADDKIFTKGNYAIIKTESNTSTEYSLAESLAIEMGFKNISFIHPEVHDQIIAYTSQLTHIISLSLVSSFQNNVNLTHFTGDSYRDLTRIANINLNLWPELFLQNQSYLYEIMKAFKKQFESFEKAIEQNDYDLLINLMSNAKISHLKYLEDLKNEC